MGSSARNYQLTGKPVAHGRIAVFLDKSRDLLSRDKFIPHVKLGIFPQTFFTPVFDLQNLLHYTRVQIFSDLPCLEASLVLFFAAIHELD